MFVIFVAHLHLRAAERRRSTGRIGLFRMSGSARRGDEAGRRSFTGRRRDLARSMITGRDGRVQRLRQVLRLPSSQRKTQSR